MNSGNIVVHHMLNWKLWTLTSSVFNNFKKLVWSGVIIGVLGLVCVVIVGLISNNNPIQPYERVDDKLVWAHFSIKTAADVAWIFLGLLLLWTVAIYFYFKQSRKNSLAHISGMDCMILICIILLSGLGFIGIGLGLGYWVFYYPYWIAI